MNNQKLQRYRLHRRQRSLPPNAARGATTRKAASKIDITKEQQHAISRQRRVLSFVRWNSQWIVVEAYVAAQQPPKKTRLSNQRRGRLSKACQNQIKRCKNKCVVCIAVYCLLGLGTALALLAVRFWALASGAVAAVDWCHSVSHSIRSADYVCESDCDNVSESRPEDA